MSFSVFEYEFPIKNVHGKNTKLLSTCWTFYKPKTEVETYFYKNTKGTFFNFIFTKKWITETILKPFFPHKEYLVAFFDNEIGFYTWLDISPDAHQIAKKISKIIAAEKNGIFDVQSINTLSKDLIISFFENTIDDSRMIENIALNNSDYAKIAKAEKIILLNLTLPFIGIDAIAKQVSMSATKIKSNFKTVFGFSMLQYHKEKNMLLAMQLIKKSDIMIQNIAQITGYESASKFSIAFKKRFRNLPSTYR